VVKALSLVGGGDRIAGDRGTAAWPAARACWRIWPLKNYRSRACWRAAGAPGKRRRRCP